MVKHVLCVLNRFEEFGDAFSPVKYFVFRTIGCTYSAMISRGVFCYEFKQSVYITDFKTVVDTFYYGYVGRTYCVSSILHRS